MAIGITADKIRKNTEEKDKMEKKTIKPNQTTKTKTKTRSKRQTRGPDRSLPRGKKEK